MKKFRNEWDRIDLRQLYLKAVNKSIAFRDGKKNNGYPAFTRYPLFRCPTLPDRCSFRNFGLNLFYEHLSNGWHFFLLCIDEKDAEFSASRKERDVCRGNLGRVSPAFQ